MKNNNPVTLEEIKGLFGETMPVMVAILMFNPAFAGVPNNEIRNQILSIHAGHVLKNETIMEYRVAIAICIARYQEMLVRNCINESSSIYKFCNTILEGAQTLSLTKLNRWLGYVQGVVIELGMTTVEAERDFTRPLFAHLDDKISNLLS